MESTSYSIYIARTILPEHGRYPRSSFTRTRLHLRPQDHHHRPPAPKGGLTSNPRNSPFSRWPEGDYHNQPAVTPTHLSPRLEDRSKTPILYIIVVVVGLEDDLVIDEHDSASDCKIGISPIKLLDS